MAQESQAAMFARAHQAFAERGLLRQSLRIGHGGRLYSVRCDDDCFSIYRVNEKPFMPPGLPGWTVCRLGEGNCFSLGQDEQACQLLDAQEQLAQAQAWLDLVLENLPDEP